MESPFQRAGGCFAALRGAGGARGGLVKYKWLLVLIVCSRFLWKELKEACQGCLSYSSEKSN